MTTILGFVGPIVTEGGGIVTGDDGTLADYNGRQSIVTESSRKFNKMTMITMISATMPHRWPCVTE